MDTAIVQSLLLLNSGRHPLGTNYNQITSITMSIIIVLMLEKMMKMITMVMTEKKMEMEMEIR